MKKIRTFIFPLFIMLCLLVFSINSSASRTLSGDVNNNGSVEAADARLVLRASVGLEEFNTETIKIADADNNSSLTAADARIILRMSVGLEKIVYIEDKTTNIGFEIHFIDVGQADCALVICDGETLLIDGGNTSDSSIVVEYLIREGITELDYVICTHAHEDHVGGLSGILDEFTVNNDIFASEIGADTECYKAFLEKVREQQKDLIIPQHDYSFTLSSANVEFIGPVSYAYSDINNTSLITKITYENTSFLFTGDAERDSEIDILDYGLNVKADLLKVGHHGSENSTSYRFLREVMPDYAVISCGTDNIYGHPTEEVLSRLRDAEVKVYRTDMQGNIVVTSDGDDLKIITEKNQDIETNPTVLDKPDSPETPDYPAPEEPDTPSPSEPQDPISPICTYIGNKNTYKFHLPTCSSLPKEENRIYFSTRASAISNGYEACSRCKP